MKNQFYLQLENRFRGSEQQITERLQQYVPLLEELEKNTSRVALDIGCGRGEWLGLLGKRQWQAVGIDLNAVMVESCQKQGLNAQEQDALTYLTSLPDQSQSLITGFHIAEHISFDSLLEIIQQAYRVLLPQGVLVLETPNPENLQVGTHTFYMDPSHRHPLPPQLLQFSAQEQGFLQVDIRRMNGALKPENKMAFGDHIQWFLEANLDYALVAQKKSGVIAIAQLEKIGESESHYPAFYAFARGYVEETHQRMVQSAQKQAEINDHQQQQMDDQQQQILIIQQNQTELDAIKNSLSWRITKPLRQLSLILKYYKQFGLKNTITHSYSRLLNKLGARVLMNPKNTQRALKILKYTPRLNTYLRNRLLTAKSKQVDQQAFTLDSPRALKIWQDLVKDKA
ncbi:MAG TPA: class I SAM-dependent methyltransferase [Methylococcales bacterium]|nr:class I SAM-dependent methyltransferase [Methylococcales bacterium]